MKKLPPFAFLDLPRVLATAICLAVLPLPSVALAGGTPATSSVSDELITITGSESKTEDGDYLTANDGLDSYHSFFIEVPAGATSLEVDLFDMDVLYGIDDGTNTEQIAERDRIRRYSDFLADPVGNFNDHIGASVAKYELFDPSGNPVVTKHIFGSHFAPGNADGAWLNFYDSDLADTSSGDQFLDQFGSASYSNNNGTVNFAGPWVEDEQAGVRFCNTGAGPGSGLLRITGGELRITDDCDFNPDMGREPSIYRELDLSAYTSAVLSFDFRTLTGTEKNDAIVLELSGDGGTTWSIIDAFTHYPGTVSGSRSYDISDFIAINTRIRFRVENVWAGNNNEVLFIDDFEVRATADAAAAPAPGHWELRVDMSSGTNDGGSGFNGDETNAFGFRAHDGDETAGGTEYNVYTAHYTAGINPNDSGRDYTLYPYVTGGCDFSVNDFDWDADLPSNTAPDPDLDPPFGSVVVTSPDTAFTSSSTLSANDTWAGSTATGFTSDQEVDQYGIWTLDARVEDPVDGNYAPIYVGTYEDLDLAPATIPDPESFRIYLPTDGGGAPAKPYLTQRLTVFTTQPSGGSNPPAPGETTRYAVSLVVWNPDGSIGDVTFDGLTRLVTAHLPGGDVTYQGLGFLTQGSIVSQPTVGSNVAGDLTWNPGTVAAGSGGSANTASLVYVVDITGPATPYTVEVTPDAGTGNGTRATWVDETGVQDYATGELCRLQIVNAAATPVVVTAVDTFEENGETVVQWTTASEAGTRAFDVYRVGEDLRAEPVNEHPITAYIGHVGGGTYRLADPDADLSSPTSYWIVEIDSRGRRNPYGPFEAKLEGGTRELPTIGPRLLDAAHAARLDRARAEAAAAAPSKALGAPAERLKLGVDRTGMQRVSATDLAAAFGLPESQVRDTIRTRGFVLTLDSEPLPWTADGDEGLLFYGRALAGPYSDRRVYWLEPGKGESPIRSTSRRPPPDWSGESFRESLWLEENLRPVVILDLDPEGENWFWKLVRPGGSSAVEDFPGDVPDPVTASPEPARVEVHLQGGAAGEHQVLVRFNGEELGTVDVSGDEAVVAAFDVAGEILDGENTLQLEALSGDIVFLEGFRLDYERRALAQGNALTLTLDDASAGTVAGFEDPDIRVFDVTDPERPRPVQRPRILPEDGTYRVVFPADRGRRTYATVAPGGYLSPELEVDLPSDLLSDDPGVEYLVIAAPELGEAAEALTTYRRDRGLHARQVSLTDVYDTFTGGVTDPRAIRDFLAHVWNTWTAPPRQVVLMGHGTYDFRDHWGLGGNLLPPLMTARPGSLFPTDALFGDVEGDDGIPEMVVGRIPALTAQEVADFVTKLQAYEAAGDTDWDHRLLALADDTDAAGDFAADSRALQELLGFGFEATEIHLDDQPDLATARGLLQDALAAGAALVGYAGHGGVDRLADGAGLLASADVPLLQNGDRPTILAAATCNIGLHAFPGLDGLGEVLVLEPSKGTVATFAPAWLLENAPGKNLLDRLFRRVFQHRDTTLGEAVRRALESAAAGGAEPHVLRSFQLIGDPATELQVRPEPPPPGCEADCGNG